MVAGMLHRFFPIPTMSSAFAPRSVVCILARVIGVRLLLPLCCLLAPAALFAGFGLTTDPTFYTVDTDAGLVFKVRRVDLGVSTQSPGDLATISNYKNARRDV